MQTAADVVVLVTKLQSPRLLHRPMPRKRLYDALDGSRHCRLLLVCAPAGFGKTTLLADWAARAGSAAPTDSAARFVWLTLDQHDNDPPRFWRHFYVGIADCLAKIRPNQLLPAPPDGQQPHQLDELINALADACVAHPLRQEQPQRLVIILDNYHLVQSPVINDAVGFLVDHLPDGATLAIATRADPQLPLARLRVSGALAELRAADLCFTLDETRVFLRSALTADLPAGLAERAHALTKGWPAAVYLAVLAACGRADEIEHFAALFTSDEYILDYLAEEVVHSQPKAIQDFLLQTCILSTLNASLCDHVTGRSDGALRLSQLQHWGAFLSPTDEQNTQFCYHPLLAHGLQVLLQRETPQLRATLHSRASDWYAVHGDELEAIGHAQLSGDERRLADRIGQAYRTLILRGELVTLMRLLESVPEELTDNYSRVALAYAWSHIYKLQFSALERYLGAAEAALAHEAPSEMERIRGEICMLRALFESVYGSPERAMNLAERAQATIAADDVLMQIALHTALGNVHRAIGHLPAAIAEYEQVCALGSVNASMLLTVVGHIRLAQCYALCGRLDESLPILQRAVTNAAPQSGEPSLFAAEAAMSLAERYYERNELPKALALVKHSIALAQQNHSWLALVNGLRCAIQVLLVTESADAAERLMETIQSHALAAQSPLLAEIAALRRTWLNLALGRADRAQAWADAYRARGRHANLSALYVDEAELALSSIDLLAGRPKDAAKLLQSLLARTLREGRLRTALEARCRLALAYEAFGDRAAATRELLRALRDAAAQGFPRVVVDLGKPMFELLEAVAERHSASEHDGQTAAARAYLSHILRLFGKPGAQTGRAGLLEAMTPREQEVLELLVRGASNAEIAHALTISVGTVKAHTNRIFGKLSARNRTEAASHARALGLMDRAH